MIEPDFNELAEEMLDELLSLWYHKVECMRFTEEDQEMLDQLKGKFIQTMSMQLMEEHFDD